MTPTVFARLSHSLVRRRTVWLLALLALSGGLIWASVRLSLRLDVADFLPAREPAAGEFTPERVSELTGAGYLAVLLESDEAMDTETVAPVFAYLAAGIERLPMIRSVHPRLSPAEMGFKEDYLPRHILLYIQPEALRAASDRLTAAGIEGGLAAADSVADSVSIRGRRAQRDPLGLILVAARALERWQGVSRVRLIDGYYALPGGGTFFMTIESEAGLDDIVAARSLVASVDSVLRAATADPRVGPVLSGRRLSLVGRPVSFVSAFDTLYRDVVRVATAAAIVVFVLLALFFRRFAAPLVLLVPVGIGLLAAAATAAIVFGSVSLVAWVFVGLMIGLGVDFGVHIATHYWCYGDGSRGREGALASALARPGPGVILGGLTSAAAFLSVGLIPYPALREVAWLTATGLVAILAASLIVLPLLLSFTAPSRERANGWERWNTLWAPGRRARPLRDMAPWVLLIGLGLMVLPSLHFEAHPWKLAVRGNPESARLGELSHAMGTSFTPLLMVSRAATRAEAIERDRQAVRELQRVALRAGVASIHSLGRWLPAPENQAANIEFVRQNRSLFSPQRFTADFEAAVARLDAPSPYLTDEYLPLIAGALDPSLEELTLEGLRDLGLGDQVDRHLVPTGDGFAAVSYVFLRQFPWAEGVVSRFVDVATDAGLYDLPGVTLAGEALRSSTHIRVIRRGALVASAVAVLLVGGLLWLRFRRVRLVILCLAPLACGLSAALVVMRLMNIELNLISITIAPLLVGIGVDDGIHMVERLRSGQDVATVLREAGSAMTLTTLTTVGALGCLAFATFSGIRELGLVGSVGLLVCLVASLRLVPLGWALMMKRGDQAPASRRRPLP